VNVAEVLRLCYDKALDSPDPSTQNAAVLCWEDSRGRLGPYVETFACNEFPYGVAYKPERWERPLKYAYVEHAERNCLYKACRRGRCTKGEVMVSPWAACADCARAIVQAGVRKLITQRHDDEDRWKASIDVAFTILAEGGVDVVFFEGKVGGSPIRRDGKLWQP
jgi:dCMP deaminase